MKRVKYLLIAAILICVTGCGQSTKEYDPSVVEAFLEKEGMKTYFSYKGNYYDKDYKCYDVNYTKEKECEREIDFWDFFAIDSYREGNYIESYVSLNDNDEIKQVSIDYKKIIKKEKYSEDYDEYSISNDGKEEYYYSYRSSPIKTCYNIIKSDEIKDRDECSEKEKLSHSKIKEEFDELLSNYDLTYEDLFKYYEWYANEYIMPMFKAAKEDAKKDYSYEEVKNVLDEKDVKITITSNKKQVLLSEKYLDDQLYISPKTDESLGYILYSNDQNVLYVIGVYDDLDDIFGLTGDCFYNFTKSETRDGYTCTENEIEKLRMAKINYEVYVDSLNLKISELRMFGKEYIKNNA